MATLLTLASAEELGVMLKTQPEDSLLVSSLQRSSNRFRGAVKWLVSDTVANVKLDGHGRHSLRLPGKELQEVTSVIEQGVLLVEGIDYDWSEDGILDRLNGTWPDRRRSVEVTYKYGYAEIPGDIQEVVLDQAAALYRIKRGLSSEQAGGISRVYGKDEATGVTQSWSDAVDRHKIQSGDRA